jgi:hypothetical protein
MVLALTREQVQSLHTVVDNFAYLLDKFGIDWDAENAPLVIEAREALQAIDELTSPSDEA